jgi:nitrogen fixation NifU-like protein
MSDLRDLYQEVILDHGKNPRNHGRPAGCNRSSHGYTPLCGDKVTIYLTIEDGVVTDVGFEGAGCAISMASASLMTEVLKGKAVADVEAIFRRFHELMTGEDDPADDLGESMDLDKLLVLSGVREFPIRVKCATLAWHTMNAAVEGRDDVSTE